MEEAEAVLQVIDYQASQGDVVEHGHKANGSGRTGGMAHDPPMTWSGADTELDVMYSTLLDPWLMYPIIMAVKGPAWMLTWPRWRRTLGVMIKLRDDVSGGLDARGRVSKGLTARDAERLDAAEQAARRVLIAAGCDADSLIRTPLRGTHPCATARIGDVVDEDLATAVPNLHVCDASVFPEALGRPTVLTILALARRLAGKLLS